MKRTIAIIFIALSALILASGADAQDRKAERQARRELRRELRRQERAVKDSLMAVIRANSSDSVNVGFGYTRKRDLTSSVSRLRTTPGSVETYSNIADYIQGRVPGVMVRKEGDSYRYIVRGIGTNSDATDPLLMFDGVEVDNFNSILPSQVESVEVIKDGSASIYGMRGANGVIMITTKSN